MKIDGSDAQLNPLLSVDKEQSSDQRNNAPVRSSDRGQDRLEFSTESRAIQPLVDQVKQSPDIRTDKVAEISQQVESGTYNVRAEVVADAIISGSIVSEKV